MPKTKDKFGKTEPLSATRRQAQFTTQAAIIEEHGAKRGRFFELIEKLRIRLDELIVSKVGPDLHPACRIILDEHCQAYKSSLETVRIIGGEHRAVKNAICLDLSGPEETKAVFDQKFQAISVERNLRPVPKMKFMNVSPRIRRECSLGPELATNARGSPNFSESANYFYSHLLQKSDSFLPNIANLLLSPRHSKCRFKPYHPESETSATRSASIAPEPRSTSTPEPRSASKPESTTTEPPAWFPTEAEPTPTAPPRSLTASPPEQWPDSETNSAQINLINKEFIFHDNIFLSKELLNHPNLKAIRNFYSNIKTCFGDMSDFATQVRVRNSDLSYLQRGLILACRSYKTPSYTSFQQPLIKVKKYNYLPKPNDNHCLLMALNFLELLKTAVIQTPDTLPIHDPLPQGFIAVNADKTSNACILPRQIYTDRMSAFISANSSIFKKICISTAYSDVDRVTKVLDHIRLKARCWDILKDERDAVLSKNSALPKLRGLCKTHKVHDNTWTSLNFRPIIGSSASVLSNLAILLDKVLQPLAEQVQYRLRDTFETLDFFQKVDLEKYYIVPFDASSLYTNISKRLAQTAISYWLDDPELLDLVPLRFREFGFIEETIDILFSLNYFLFNGFIYLQHDGLSMGCNQCRRT